MYVWVVLIVLGWVVFVLRVSDCLSSIFSFSVAAAAVPQHQQYQQYPQRMTSVVEGLQCLLKNRFRATVPHELQGRTSILAFRQTKEVNACQSATEMMWEPCQEFLL